MKWKVPQFEPLLGKEEADAAAACVLSGWITEGPLCAQFVEKVKQLAGVKYGVLAPNGTLALYLALKACGVGREWEVIVPDFTFIATATAVTMAGAKPVFVDVNRYGQLSMKAAEAAVENSTSPQMTYLPVHLFGAASNEYLSARDIPFFVEDACQALGVSYEGAPCGSLGKASAFSFFADKTITTGEGGFVGTNNGEVYEKLRYLRNQGRLERGSFMHQRIGQNFRMTDVQAAIGLAQITKLPAIIKRKQAVYHSYEKKLAGVVRLLEPPPGSSHIPFRAVAVFEKPASDAMQFLKDRGIEPRSVFYPLHKQPCFAVFSGDPRHEDSLFPQTNHFWDRAVCLPTFPGIEEWQIDLVCETIKEFVREAHHG